MYNRFAHEKDVTMGDTAKQLSHVNTAPSPRVPHPPLARTALWYIRLVLPRPMSAVKTTTNLHV